MEDIQNKNVAWHIHKRKVKKIRLFVLGMVMVIVSAIAMYVYSTLKQNEYITFSEKANVNYIVNLKENDYYDKSYVGENTDVIASLIKNIEATFRYNLNFEKNNTYIYDYKITARTEVKEDKKTNIIYDKEEEIFTSVSKEVNSNKLEINEKVDVDYNKYNEKIKKFVNVYDLDDTNCTLELTMYLNVRNKYDNTQINKDEKVMTLYIPLTTKTVDISLTATSAVNNGTVLERTSVYGDIVALKIISIILALTGLATLIKFVKYVNDTRSAEKMYDKTLKNILFSYKQYIQKITVDLDKEKYKIVEVEKFSEILEIKESLQSPILMYTEEGVRRTRFMIINNEILFVYTLGSQEIRNKLIEESKKNKKEN